MDEQRDHAQPEQVVEIPLTTKAGIVAVPSLLTLGIDALAHGGATPVGLAAFFTVMLAANSPKLAEIAGKNKRLLVALSTHDEWRQRLDRMSDGHFTRQIIKLQQERPDLFVVSEPKEARAVTQALPEVPATATPPTVEDSIEETIALFSLTPKQQPLPCPRITMKDIVAHTPRNSYIVWLGRNLTDPGMPAVAVNILKQHIKLIGASQKGKSSMAACILDQIRQTHDLTHALVAILDLEDRTGLLFEHDPHIVTFRMDGQDIKMHARSREQVLEYLGYIVQLMDWRYTLSVPEVKAQPLLIVYVEEFLALKDYYKRRVSTAKDQKAAQADYDQLIYCISELARRGLKARIQLLLCAQVDYRDEDLAEALANITAGMSFCVKSTAAQAAGFTDAELLKRNQKDNIVGQAVAEFSGCRGLILAPDYPLEQKIEHLSAVSPQSVQSAPFTVSRSHFGADSDRQSVSESLAFEQSEEAERKVLVFPENGGNGPVERPDLQTEDRLKYRFTETEIAQFVAAYRIAGNIEKVLASMRKGAGYKPHAREIIQAYGLRKDA